MARVSIYDKRLRQLETKVTNEYFKAWEEMSVELDRYTNGWDEVVNGKPVHHKGMYERKEEEKASGAYTDKEFDRWWAAQEGRQQHWISMRDQMAEKLTRTNEIASAYMRDELPYYYVTGSSEVIKIAQKSAMEQGVTGVRFDLIDEHTVKNLIKNNKSPFPQPSVKIASDKLWNRQKLQSALTQGILQGDSTDKLARRFQAITNMNRASAIRNARTATTSARNAGKQDRFEELTEKGCTVTKIWVDVHDSVPPERPEHWEASGQEVPWDEPFIVGGEELMYPGDPAGSGWNIYNCRCEMKTGKIIFKSVLDDEKRAKANIRVV